MTEVNTDLIGSQVSYTCFTRNGQETFSGTIRAVTVVDKDVVFLIARDGRGYAAMDQVRASNAMLIT